MTGTLLNAHQDMLDVKNIRTEEELARIVQADLDKIVWAVSELKNMTAPQLLTEFFGEDEIFLPGVGNRALNHIGFEICEPLDLLLYDFGRRFGNPRTKIWKMLRFPASPQFQERAGAYVEIMRIWLKINACELMLELFDMHRPIDVSVLAPPSGGVLDSHDLSGPADRRFPASLLAHDEIWHYAVYVDRTEYVSELHECLRSLARENSGYVLPFPTIVHNRHDGSFYTKIINSEKRLELEFVTETGSESAIRSVL